MRGLSVVSPEGVEVVVDAGPDGFPHIRVHDDSLVSADYEEDVDEDDLVAPVIFYPATQRTINCLI